MNDTFYRNRTQVGELRSLGPHIYIDLTNYDKFNLCLLIFEICKYVSNFYLYLSKIEIIRFSQNMRKYLYCSAFENIHCFYYIKAQFLIKN